MLIITKPLTQALGLKWIPLSKKNMISIDGKFQPAVWGIENLQVVIADAVTDIKAHVVNLAAKSILLKTD